MLFCTFEGHARWISSRYETISRTCLRNGTHDSVSCPSVGCPSLFSFAPDFCATSDWPSRRETDHLLPLIFEIRGFWVTAAAATVETQPARPPVAWRPVHSWQRRPCHLPPSSNRSSYPSVRGNPSLALILKSVLYRVQIYPLDFW